MNQHAKFVGQRSFSSKVIGCTHIDPADCCTWTSIVVSNGAVSVCNGDRICNSDDCRDCHGWLVAARRSERRTSVHFSEYSDSSNVASAVCTSDCFGCLASFQFTSLDFTKKLRSLVCVFNLPHIRFHVHVIYSLPLTYMYLHTYFSIYPVWIAIYTWHLIYKCGAGSPLPHFFSFHFSVFSDAMLRVSCEILWECGPVNLLGSVWPNSLLNPPYVEPKQKLLESPRFHWIK